METAGGGDELVVRVFLTRVSGNPIGTPDLSGSFSAAFLWEGRCCVLYPSCISGLPLWSSGGGVSGRGCTFSCGWA